MIIRLNTWNGDTLVPVPFSVYLDSSCLTSSNSSDQHTALTICQIMTKRAVEASFCILGNSRLQVCPITALN